MDYRATVEALLPIFVLAGDYALTVQTRVEATTKSAEGTIFSQAVTAADTSIQGLFEIALLPLLPHAAFFGEERSVLQNQRFFQQDSMLRVTLDPLNHTIAFIDGYPAFDIILTISDGPNIQAAVVYLPAYGEFYIGIAGSGAYSTTRAHLREGRPWQQRTLSDLNAPVLIYDSPALATKIPERLGAIDLARSYKPNSDWNVTISSILRGGLSGYFRPNASILDWGAVAFIVEQAGGVVSDAAGKAIPSYWDYDNHRIPSLLVAVSGRIHEELLQLM